MADRIQQARTEELDKETDAFVWSVVHYLDSRSDYREYLPCSRRTTSIEDSELILLDDVPRYIRKWLVSLSLVAVVICIILLAVMRS